MERRLVRLRAAASAPNAQGRHEGHVAELIAEALDRWPNERASVRVLSTDSTMVVEPSQADLLPPRTPPGEMVLPYRCASEFFLRRALGQLIAQVELVEHIISFLQLPQVSGVAATGATSTAQYRACDPKNTLVANDESWWISSIESCPNGVGSEWVQYQLCAEGRVRVQFVQLKIPRLPYGPLSVRVFHLEAADEERGPFQRVSPDLITFDTDRMQEWALLPPVEARFIRIVCKMNAAASELEDKWQRLAGMRLAEASAIGFLQIGFS
jgi:hypothetical protein